MSIRAPLVYTGETTQQVVTAAVTGDTGWSMPTASDTVKVAFGAEYRRDALSSTPDVSFTSGDGAGQGGPTIGHAGSTSVAAAFGEFQIPLADDQPWAYSASIDGAYRRSEYENFGADTYKLGADYAPVEDIRFRASYSRAVRAPNAIELFTAPGFGLFDADRDPCDSTTGAVVASCIGTNPWQVTVVQSGSGALDSPAGQYARRGSGTATLVPEESDTLTYGVVWSPSFLRGFNLSIDYSTFRSTVRSSLSTRSTPWTPAANVSSETRTVRFGRVPAWLKIRTRTSGASALPAAISMPTTASISKTSA